MKRLRFYSLSSLAMSLFVIATLVDPGSSLAVPLKPITAPGTVPDYFETPNWANSPPLRKFLDSVAPLGCTTPNLLGQCIPVASPANFPYNGNPTGSDYYEIAVVEYREQMHSDLLPLLNSSGNPTTVKTAAYSDPNAAVSGGTKLRGYVQEVNGVPVTQPHYLGPIIVAQKDRPVRIKFINRLPGGTGGNLFLPVDTTIMGSGEYTINYDPETKSPRALKTGSFTQNRAELHLHGGRTPWISDGTPHQWITPAADAAAGQPAADYPKGVSVAYVPDMWYDKTTYAENVACRGQNVCAGNYGNNPGPGAQTFYWTNAQSARLMFYHDHAWGLTRLNVYAGEAAGYAIEDSKEKALFGSVTDTPAYSTGSLSASIEATIPLVIQDKTFVDPNTIKVTDPTWAWGSTPPSQTFTTNADGSVTGSPALPALSQSGQGMNPVKGDLWWPHVYMPAQNPFNPNLSGINDMGRWHYGPWFFPSTPVCGTSPQAVKPLCIEVGVKTNEYASLYANQPPQRPGTPNVSWGAEAFLDTMMVNGTVFPKLELPTNGVYRLRILNASHDRFLNLQFYQAEPMSIGVTNGGSGYTSPPTVTISGDGSGATATATISGTVSGITLTSGGSGYTSAPSVSITGAGTGATATATIGNGITGLVTTFAGSGYKTAPTVTFTGGGGSGASAVATIEGYVNNFVINNGGSGYVAPVVTITGGGGMGAEATANIDGSGTITGFTITEPGVWYTSAPTVTITDASGPGTGADIAAELSAIVSAVTLTSSGTGYGSAPTIGFTGGSPTSAARARATFGSGVVTAITVNPGAGGTGYSSSDTVVTLSGGGGSGAAATASITGSVTAVTVTEPGTGYTTAPTVSFSGGGGAAATAYLGTEVKMVPASATAGFPLNWPIDAREGGVPDPAYRGPAFIQIASEGGFLPGPVVIPNQPVRWNVDPTMFNVGNVLPQRDGGGALILGPAERADVLVDFTNYNGKTLILYNDAPTAFPALDPHYDYYTGAPDRTDIGGYTAIQPGVGPNVRTVMQIKVGTPVYGGQPALVDDINTSILGTLQTEFAGAAGVFATGQDEIVVGQSAYDTALGKTFPSTFPNWGVARISDGSISFKKADNTTQVTNFAMKPKAIHDEMGGTFDEYGRMSAKLGLEAAFTNTTIAGFFVQNYVDPATEFVRPGEPQIWRITHNGVDTHPIHFHLFDVQVLNRVGWDGFIRLPDDGELGWKDTVKMNPLEDTIVAFRPIKPPVPFGLPNSIRPMNPQTPVNYVATDPVLANMGFSNVNPVDGNPLVPPTENKMVNFGHEYVWHCHILSHEENDMMRTIVMQMPHNDFNGDGKTDILWQKTDGSAMIWNMNGLTYLSTTNLASEPDTTWKMVAAADFNHDGKPDILWRNTADGNNRIWLMDGAVQTGSTVTLPQETTLDWEIAATGDLNNDGNVDIIWRHKTNGQNRVWLMNGTSFASNVALQSNTNNSAKIVGAGDFNNDGKTDIVWRNSSNGNTFVWVMNGTVRTTTANLQTNTNTAATIVGTGDFNADGKIDILWRNTTNGNNFVWIMDGFTRTATASVQSLPLPANADWLIVGK